MSAPDAPVLIYPSASAVGIRLAPEYLWQEDDVGFYKIEISDKADFSHLLASATLTTFKFFSYPVLPAGTRIYWRVAAGIFEDISSWASSFFDTDSPDFGFRLINDHVAHGKSLILHQFQENFG